MSDKKADMTHAELMGVFAWLAQLSERDIQIVALACGQTIMDSSGLPGDASIMLATPGTEVIGVFGRGDSAKRIQGFIMAHAATVIPGRKN
jgi:hypothetical protein